MGVGEQDAGVISRVVWGGVTGESLTWELESKMQESYPELFVA